MTRILQTIAFLLLFQMATALAQYPADLRISPSELDIAMSTPSIYSVHGLLLTSWIRSDHTIDLVRWEGESVTPIDRTNADLFSPPVLDSTRAEEIKLTNQGFTLLPAAPYGPPSFTRVLERTDIVSYHLSSPDTSGQYQTVQTRGDVGIATATGWRNVFTAYAGGIAPLEQHIWLRGIAWDPNRREVVVASGVAPLSGGILSAYDVDGSLVWSDSCVTDLGTILPLAPSDYLLVRDDSALTYHRMQPVGAIQLPEVIGTSTSSRLLGPWFVRITQPDALSRRVIERFDLGAHRIDSMTIEFPAPVTDLRLLQDESDSTLILLYVRNGVRMARLTQNLRVLYQDSLISVAQGSVAHPAGTVRNDTLFAVWESSIGSAIYGNWLRLEKMSSVAGVRSPEAPSGAAAPALVRLYPNPARDVVRIEYRSAKECDLEVVDQLGRVLRHVTASANPVGSVDLSTSDLESGVYLVRLRSADATSVARLVVVR